LPIVADVRRPRLLPMRGGTSPLVATRAPLSAATRTSLSGPARDRDSATG
jgi:hypothetical protein